MSAFDLRAKQALNNGFGNAWARGFELVITPMIFIAIGFGLGTWLGARPLLTLVFGAFGVIGTIVKLMYGYDLEMKKHEAEGPWAKRS